MDVYQRRRLVALSAIAAVFIIVVLLIRSCGGDDEEAPVTPVAGATGAAGATALTLEDYLNQGDGLCLQANTALAAIDESDPAAAATEEARVIAGELEQLQTLTLAPEEEGQDRLEKFLDALQRQVEAYQEYITAIERGDETATAEIEATLEETAGDVEDAARAFGFEVCGDSEQIGEASSGGEDVATDGATEPAPPTETVTPTVPAPPPVPTTPAPPTDGGGTTPPVTPPADDSGDSGSGGISP